MNADAKHKLIRHYAVTDAAVHDSQELDGLLDKGNTCNDVFADSAYRSAEIEAKLRASGYNSRIHRRGRRNHPLSLAQHASEPRQEPDTRSHRACVRGAAERAGRSDRANDRHRAGARQDRLAEPGLQHSPPGDAGTARRGMKTVESSAVFQPKQRAEKGSREDGKSIENRTQPELVPNQASKSTIVRGARQSRSGVGRCAWYISCIALGAVFCLCAPATTPHCDGIFARDRYIPYPLWAAKLFFVGTERAHSAAGTHPYPGPRIIVFVAVSGGHVLSARIVTGIVAGVLVGINFYSYYFSWMALGLGLSTWLGVAAFLRRWKDVKTLCIIGLTAVITGAPFLSLPLWDCNPK